MADRLDKQTRKDKLHQWRAQQRAAARAKLPLPDEQMRSMFDMLDAALRKRGCDRTLGIVQEWAEREVGSFDTVAAWCRENGGFCDCEVLANCKQHWLDAKHDVDW